MQFYRRISSSVTSIERINVDSSNFIAILRDRRGGVLKPLTLKVLRERVQDTPELVDQDDIGGCGCFVDED